MEGVRQFFKEWHAFAVVDACPFRSPDILDIGCGHGEIGMMLAQNKVECHFISVDVKKKFKRKTQPFGSMFYQADLTKESIQDVPGSAHGFDVVFMYDFLQNVDPVSAAEVVADLPTIVRPGGSLCIHTRNSLMEAETDANHHLHRPDIEKLLVTLAKDFDIINVFGINFGHHEADLPAPTTSWDRFMPDRVRRITYGLDTWQDCKWVLIDAVRRDA
jgi:2-polyprenyl-3-methyl-5-hydroxy-6-metoxy-1,4-benzoquinol methylase